MNVTEGFKFDNISGVASQFSALGGKYMLTAVIGTLNASGVGLDTIGEDGATWLPVVMFTSDGASSSMLKASGTAVVDLPPGRYRINCNAATGVYVTVARVPY